MLEIIRKFIILSVALHGLIGCVPIMATGAVATGVAVNDERTMNDIVNDVVIKSKIVHRYSAEKYEQSLRDVVVKVKEGRVLLAGSVRAQQDMNNAIKEAWEVDGVLEVINEIKLGDNSLWRFSKDATIKSQIKTKYMLQKNIKSLNYTVVVKEGIVYLFGIAQNVEERDIAVDIASRVRGVQQVVNHVIIKDDARRNDK